MIAVEDARLVRWKDVSAEAVSTVDPTCAGSRG